MLTQMEEEFFFAAGAGNDTQGWHYTSRWQKALEKVGIKGFRALKDISHDTPGSFPINDILFTHYHRNVSYERIPVESNSMGVATKWENRPTDDSKVKKIVDDVIADVTGNPLEKGEQLNMVGYSYGSVAEAHAILQLAEKGYKVDNFVMVGSPIEDDSELYQKLSKVTKITRIDIPGDYLSNPSGLWEFIKGANQNSSDSGPHFDLARPGAEADKKIENAAETIKAAGVE